MTNVQDMNLEDFLKELLPGYGGDVQGLTDAWHDMRRRIGLDSDVDVEKLIEKFTEDDRGNAYKSISEAEERRTVPNSYIFAEEVEDNRRAAKVAVDAMSRGEQHTIDVFGKGWKKKR